MRPMSVVEAMARLRDCRALSDGHYVGTQQDPSLPEGRKGGGLHMDKYVDGRRLVTFPRVVEQFGQGIAYGLAGLGIEVIVGIPIGSYTLGNEVAKALDVRYVMLERATNGALVVRANRKAFLELLEGKRAGIVEDTMSRGDTAQKAVEVVESNTGLPVAAVGCIINRGGATRESVGAPVRALITAQDMPMLTREECLARGQCSRKVPINTDLGHGADLRQLIDEGLIPADERYIFAKR